MFKTLILSITLLISICSPGPAMAEIGTASWYDYQSCIKEGSAGICANGRPMYEYDNRYVCASWFYPLGSMVRITSGKASITCEVVDRGPARRLIKKGRIIDLNRKAFQALSNGKLDKGILQVEVTKL